MSISFRPLGGDSNPAEGIGGSMKSNIGGNHEHRRLKTAKPPAGEHTLVRRPYSEASRRYHADDNCDWSKEYMRESWIDWRAVAIGITAALVAGVLVAGACLLLTGAVFGFNPIELASDIRSVLP